jgi:hypothetical protein
MAPGAATSGRETARRELSQWRKGASRRLRGEGIRELAGVWMDCGVWQVAPAVVDALFGPGTIGGEAGRRTEGKTSKLGVFCLFGAVELWWLCSCEKKLLCSYLCCHEIFLLKKKSHEIDYQPGSQESS